MWFSEPSVLELLCSEWVSAGLGVWEHKSDIYLTFLSLSPGRKASSSAVNLSSPCALVQHSCLSHLGLPGVGVGRCLLSGAAGGGVQPGRSTLGSGRDQDLVPPKPQQLQPPGKRVWCRGSCCAQCWWGGERVVCELGVAGRKAPDSCFAVW